MRKSKAELSRAPPSQALVNGTKTSSAKPGSESKAWRSGAEHCMTEQILSKAEHTKRKAVSKAKQRKAKLIRAEQSKSKCSKA